MKAQRRPPRAISTLVSPFLAWAYGAPAMAAEPLPGDDEPTSVDVTMASSLIYNGNNRNQRPSELVTRLDDDWSLWYNRVNLRASRGHWSVMLRGDSAWFLTNRGATSVALELTRERTAAAEGEPFNAADAAFFRRQIADAGQELSTRFVSWTYPAKYAVSYQSPRLELTLGDGYAQLGRGLVLSTRKVDELAGDTSIRGVRATAKHREGPWHLRFTGIAGAMNPLRVDDASGAYLSVDDGVTPGLLQLTEAAMPTASANPIVPHPAPTYAPDRVLAAQLQMGTRALQAGLQGSLLLRQAPLTRDAVRSANSVQTGSIYLDLPDLFGQGSAYGEVALQSLSGGDTETGVGSALYLNLELHERPVRLGIEARRYVSFFPLRANVDLARAREFGAVQYSSPPTTEPIWNDTQFEAFNTCVLGGRARLDVDVSQRRSIFGWIGRQDTWAELGTNEGCQRSDDRKNEVWDLATGLEFASANGLSRREWMVGVRFDAPAEPLAAPGGADLTRVFYREQYLRYDLIEWLTGPYSLQLQGWHRRRHQTIGGPKDPWLRGQALASLMWAERGSTGVGFEYDANPAFPSTYLNATAQYQLGSYGNLSLFVGQRLGGLRCVSGVCRIFAPFEGARLDFTMRL